MRVIASAPATLRHRFTVAPSGGATVEATDLAGDPVTVGAPADAEADGVYEAEVGAAAMPTAADLLTVLWGDDGEAAHLETVLVDVAGAVFVNRAALEEVSALASAPAWMIDQVADHVEDRIETYCGVAWVPRVEVETLRRRRWDPFGARWPQLREIRTVTVDGTAGDVTAWDFDRETGVIYPPALTSGAEVVLTYEHGHDRPHFDLADAAQEAAEQLLREALNQHTPKRAEFAEGASWLIATASPQHGRLFGIPTRVDAVLQQRQQSALVAR